MLTNNPPDPTGQAASAPVASAPVAPAAVPAQPTAPDPMPPNPVSPVVIGAGSAQADRAALQLAMRMGDALL